MEEPIFFFERLAAKLHIRNPLLFPVPIIIAYVLISLFPNYYLISVKYIGPLIKNHDPSIWFDYNVNWFILTIYALYAMMFYKHKFFSLLEHLKRKDVIDEEVYNEARRSFTNRKHLIAFLFFFETLFYLWWMPRDLPGFFIASIILPIGADIFSSLTAGALLPSMLSKRIRVDVFDSDRQGGLKPLSELLIVLVFVYFIGISISFILYPHFFTFFIGGGPTLILFGILIFFVSQLSMHRLLAKDKESRLENIQIKIRDCYKRISELDSGDILKQSDNLRSYETYVSNLKNLRDEVNLMGTWPFGLHIPKFIAPLSSSIGVLSFILEKSTASSDTRIQSLIYWGQMIKDILDKITLT